VWVNQGDYLTGDIADATDAQGGPVQKRRGGRRGGPRQG
jgi:small subunit ribosomal protein S3